MKIWVPGLTGSRRPANYLNEKEWAEPDSVGQIGRAKIRVHYKGRRFDVWREHTLFGACTFCKGPVRGDLLIRAESRRFCGTTCRAAQDAKEALGGMG
jgi:hypothetical protein